jgi:hypothetical protein
MSFVKVMWMEHSEPGDNSDIEIQEPSIAQIEEAIAGMNGFSCSYVMLFPSDETSEIYLAIAGGTQGYYFVSHWDGVAGVEIELANPTVTSEEYVDVELGQISRRKACQLVDRDTAQRVARIFAETGKLAAELPWKQA